MYEGTHKTAMSSAPRSYYPMAIYKSVSYNAK